MTQALLPYMILSGAIGFFVGLSELVNRYNSFNKIFKNTYSWIYMFINLGAGLLVYYVIVSYNIKLGELSAQPIGVSLFAGLGAMAFLRSSFFTYKTATDQTIYVGPAAILSIFLRASETAFDRILSNENVRSISTLMKGLQFMSASKDLPVIILAAMRVLSSDEQKSLSDDILKLVNDPATTTEAKNIAMGCILIKYTDLPLLKTAVDTLKEVYENVTKPNLDKITTLQQKLNAL